LFVQVLADRRLRLGAEAADQGERVILFHHLVRDLNRVRGLYPSSEYFQ
jgi:hypothetical protein